MALWLESPDQMTKVPVFPRGRRGNLMGLSQGAQEPEREGSVVDGENSGLGWKVIGSLWG